MAQRIQTKRGGLWETQPRCELGATAAIAAVAAAAAEAEFAFRARGRNVVVLVSKIQDVNETR